MDSPIRRILKQFFSAPWTKTWTKSINCGLCVCPSSPSPQHVQVHLPRNPTYHYPSFPLGFSWTCCRRSNLSEDEAPALDSCSDSQDEQQWTAKARAPTCTRQRKAKNQWSRSDNTDAEIMKLYSCQSCRLEYESWHDFPSAASLR